MNRRKRLVAILTTIVLVGIFGYVVYHMLEKKSVEYRGKQFEFRNDEFGVMLFNSNNGGEFKVTEVYESDSNYLLKIYEFQIRKSFWVKLEKDIITNIDSTNYNFSKYTYTTPISLVE